VAADVSPLIIFRQEEFEPAHAGCYDEIDDRPARQSDSLSGRAQTSRRCLAMTRQAVGEISMPSRLGKRASRQQGEGKNRDFHLFRQA
jgi:hypothetical protein